MKRYAFTLVELLVAVVIFSFMAMTLSTVSATANRFLFRQYREDLLKNRLTLSMKYIKNKLSQATEIETPSFASGANSITFYTNLVKDPSNPTNVCRPINQPALWHHFCVDGNRILHYHTGTLTINVCPSVSNLSIPSISCGSSGGTIVMLTGNIYLPQGRTNYFGRENNLPRNLVRTSLRICWSRSPAPVCNDNEALSPSPERVEHALETYIAINKPGQW